ncbi:MAG: sulfatase-like hydrolase/transferase, partial [Promethearchaeota archaeon]
MERKRPNIVVLMLDSLRPDHLGCNGCEVAKTPNIDQLAAHGINFQNAYSEYPITIPTRTALLAGIYTHTSRSWKPMGPYDL